VNFANGYIDRAHVTARVGTEVDGLGNPVYRAITFLSSNLLQIAGTPAGIGVKVIFDRTVPKDTLIVNFNDGDTLDEINLDTSQRQVLHAVQEVLDGRFSTLTQNLDMGGFKTVNNGVPTAPGDGATKGYVDGRVGEIIQAGALNVPARSSIPLLTVPSDTTFIRPAGYNAAGDGGAALFRKVATEPSHAGKVRSADGAWWEIADDVLHVKQFGAVDDGSTRADIAINAAISTAFATGRAKVLITGNTYLCFGQIVLRAGVALVGDKKATVRFSNNNNLTVPVTGDTFGPGAVAHGASLIDLVIDGNRANNAAARDSVLTHLYAADNVIVRGCVFKNAPGHTLCFAGFNCIIEDNLIENRRIQGIWFTGRPDTATNFNVNAIIRRNRITGAGSGTMYVVGLHNSLITENVIESPIIGLRNSVKVSTNGYEVTLNSTQVAGENFSLFGPGAILTLDGGKEYEVETVNSATSLTVTSVGIFAGPLPTLNNVSAVLGSADGIGICASRRLVVSNNRIRGVATYGLAKSVVIEVLQSDIDLVGNMISDTGKVGISIVGNALARQQRIAIRDNFLINTGTGADAVGDPWDKTGITVYPIGVESLSDIFIDGNTIRSDAGVGMTKHWLAIEPSAASGTIILGENTSTAEFGSAVLNEGNGFNYKTTTLGRSTFVGDAEAQQVLHRYGFSNGIMRAATVLENSGAVSTYFYNADNTAITGTFTIAPNGQASADGLGTYWHSGNFNPATKADVSALSEYAPIAGAAFTGAIGVYRGAVGTQQTLRRMGWSNGFARWAEVIEADAKLGFYAYDTSGNLTGSYNLTPQGQITSNLGEYWHSGTFGRPTSTGGVVGTVQTTTGTGSIILPSDGIYEYALSIERTSDGVLLSPRSQGLQARGVASGGTSLGSLGAGLQWILASWRIE
jgi:hypothetical protein